MPVRSVLFQDHVSYRISPRKYEADQGIRKTVLNCTEKISLFFPLSERINYGCIAVHGIVLIIGINYNEICRFSGFNSIMVSDMQRLGSIFRYETVTIHNVLIFHHLPCVRSHKKHPAVADRALCLSFGIPR